MNAVVDARAPQTQAAPATASVPPAASSGCPKGSELDEDGLCAAVVDTRGFSLVGPASSTAARPKARPAAPRVASIPASPARAPAQSSRLGDLLITFRMGSADLTDQGRVNARQFATALQDPKIANVRFEIGGHTDITGSEERNRILSKARADAVKAFLVSQGVAAGRLETQGYGSSQLAVPSAPESPANRRVNARPLN